MNQKQKAKPDNTSTVTDPSALGIEKNSKFHKEVPVYDHSGPQGLKKLIEAYDTEDNNIRLGDVQQKAEAAFEVIKKSLAVLVEAQPWFVNKHMQTEDFDRWEPFFIAFPEAQIGERQMKFTNLAPLSEVAYRLQQRDKYEQMAETNQDTHDNKPPGVHAQIEEQKAFTRYALDSAYLNDQDIDDAQYRGVKIDASPLKGIHAYLSSWQQHLIIGHQPDGSLYCGRGPLTEPNVDIAIDLDRRINSHSERKVAIYNDESLKEAMLSLPHDETHAEYLGVKKRWEADLNSLETIIQELMAHKDINYVSLHRITEKTYRTHFNSDFGSDINGYPGFKH